MLEALKALDLSLFLCLNSFHAEWLNPAMLALSGQVLWIPFIFFFIWKSVRIFGNRTTIIFSLFLLMAVLSSDVTSSYILKNVFNRYRPCREEALLQFIYQFGQKCGGKFGFVSSHAANSFAILSFSVMALNLRGFHFVLFLMPLLVSYSRIYLGVHYPGDILGGVLVGAFWGSSLTWCFNRVSAREQA